MTAPVRFTKMSGAGNDFVVIGGSSARSLGADPAAWVRRVCRRGLSVGADGVLVVERVDGGAIRVRFFNPDGAQAFCGNGSRCAARYALLEGLADRSMVLETAAGRVPAVVVGTGVRLTLPPPRDLGERVVSACGRRFEGRLVLAGVPHFVVVERGISGAPLAAWGPELRRHPDLGPEGANFDLVERVEDGLAVRTFERGVENETLSCGTGAVAAAFSASLAGVADPPVAVVPRSGVPLRVELPGSRVRPDVAVLEGDARVVFEGTLSPEATTGWPP